jgi:hypothetical protein
MKRNDMNFKVLSLAKMITYIDLAPSEFLDKVFESVNPSKQSLLAPDGPMLIKSAYPDRTVSLMRYHGVRRLIPTFIKRVMESGAKFIISLGDASSRNNDPIYAQYFPQSLGQTCTFQSQSWESKVTLLDQRVIRVKSGEFFINSLQFQHNGNTKELVQFYFPDWPSNKVPVNVKLAYEFIQTTHAQVFANTSDPVIIHGELQMGAITSFVALERVFANRVITPTEIVEVITGIRKDVPNSLNQDQIEFIATFAHNLDVHSPRPTTVEVLSPTRFEIALEMLKQVTQKSLKSSIVALILVHMMQREEFWGSQL